MSTADSSVMIIDLWFCAVETLKYKTIFGIGGREKGGWGVGWGQTQWDIPEITTLSQENNNWKMKVLTIVWFQICYLQYVYIHRENIYIYVLIMNKRLQQKEL